MGDVLMFEGDFAGAGAVFGEAADGTPWREALYAFTGYAAAHCGRIDEGRAITAAAAGASSPSARALQQYTAGEIEALDGAWSAAQRHYREALTLAEACGATFIHAISTIGLVSVQAAAGEVEQALRGYRDLIDHWERTGGWTQQWTTLRNVADLLDRLEDHEAAAFLRAGADRAPEAPTVRAETDSPRPVGSPSSGARREDALEAAREAIARHLKAAGDA